MDVARNEMTTAAAPAEKVGFLRRVVAFIIDTILLGLVNQLIAGALYGGDVVSAATVSTLVDLAYFVAMWAFVDGQTLGMKALGIKVVKTDGTPATIVTALLRYAGLILSFLVVFLGVIWVAFDKDKQGWHDKIASTYVVKA